MLIIVFLTRNKKVNFESMTLLFKNTVTSFGFFSILLHWTMAVLIIAMFFLGQYMVGLDYYDPWYHSAPSWHKSIGICLFVLLIVRFIWKMIQITPSPFSNYKPWELKIAKFTHWSFYVLLLACCISGYYIATAKGVGIDLFGLIDIPALTSLQESQAEIIEDIHEVSTWLLVVLFLLHFAAAMKHHFIDKDNTLIRMVKPFANN